MLLLLLFILNWPLSCFMLLYLEKVKSVLLCQIAAAE